RRLLIEGNVCSTADYFVYIDQANQTNPSNTFQAGDIHVRGNQAHSGINVSHIHALGIDGLVVDGNTFFFPSSSTESPTKSNNIYIDRGAWVIINGNNLFEAGADSIVLKRCGQFAVVGNHI